MNYKAYFAAEKQLNDRGFNVPRKEIIEMATGGRKHSLKTLSPFEYNEVLISINNIITRHPIESEEANKMRRKVIALFAKQGWKTPEGKSDMNRINNWCINYGKFKKSLNQHTTSELPQLISQVEKVYQSFIETL
ncbi:MAG: hypothetical protein ABI207_03350 [Crocinitomicaceae bacterium]